MVTIADVARHAGVSPSTVSYVLSGKRAISAATRERVEASIKALGYHPHAGARALASSRANVVALVLPLRTDMHVPILLQIAMAIVTAARGHDHDVLLLTNDEGVEGLHRVTRSALVDAVVVMDVELHDPRVPVLRELGLPSVLIGFPADSAGLTCVDLDFAAAAGMCVDHLADLGHTAVALVGPPAGVLERGTGFARRTVAGFEEAAARRGLRAVVRSCEPSHEAVQATAKELVAEHPEVTGLVVHNEPAVPPLLQALRELDVAVPRDMSVVALGPKELAAQVTPAPAMVPIPAEEMGRRAVELLMDKLNGRDVPDATLIPPSLLPGHSTAPPPSRT
ncbi:LacI family DNA-binding transcriptional regulator [Thermomonospora cellulosilytica]|uniref:DNA-binding LacI/PurR family transcriptional regulator n=1 Tax=Thermomonospora cellulosilytica TaxID=1411118 RepID=A0A7W3RBF2_9ACTN|nr:LacI family DNA-binding transcriptional regulator [Thermomonospora cellulosilytica]MBA9006210.1 DNA-binding LacI/PurR family transcriptional regulator [Thermomonospora cellulosilytica]